MTKQTNTKTFDYDDIKTASPVSPLSSPGTAFCTNALSAQSSTNSFKFLPQNNPSSSLPVLKTMSYPGADRSHVSCQTVESSLVPCDACHQVQSHLMNTGHTLVDLLQTEGLPSSLQRLLVVVEDTVEVGHMVASDVAQWADMQLKDIRRLAKHLQDVRGTLQPLKDRLVAAEKERERFRFHLERAETDFKQEVEKHQANIVQLEFSVQKAQRSAKETEQKLQEEQQQLKRGSKLRNKHDENSLR